MKKGIKKWAAGAALAGVIGYIAGIVTAPKSGQETREDIKKATSGAVSQSEKQLKGLYLSLDELTKNAVLKSKSMRDAGKKELNAAIVSANTAKNKLKLVMRALHEGNDSDEDLNAALEDGKEAKRNLMVFFRKK